MRPFLVIGLGGSGGKTIRYLKQGLAEWLGEVGWTTGVPRGWQFIHIDTPDTQDSPVLPGGPDLLPPNEYFTLHRDGVPFGGVVDRLGRRGANLDGWWVDPDYMNVPISFGAGQYRAIGRILGLDQQDRILRAIQGKISALRTVDAIGELQRLRSVAHQGSSTVYQKGSEPVAMIVTSLAGGTGAGLFLDVADMLRAEGEQWLDNSFGILYSADVFRELATGAKAGVHPNSAAALAEMLNGVYAGGHVEVAGEEREITRSGPAFPFLVGHANTKGVVFGDQTDVYRVIGRCLTAVMTDPKVQDDFVVYTAANWQNAAGAYADEGGARFMLMEPPHVGVLQGLGYAEVDLGVDRFKTYSERRLARDAVETLVEGHRLRTAGQERFEGMTPEAISEELAADRLTGFLNNVRINERGPDNNQILDAIALPFKERQRITGDMAARIYGSVSDTVGAKGRIDEWIDAIVEQAELLAPGENERYDSRLRERARLWTNEVSGRLTDETGEIAAEFGLQVAVDLLGLVRTEIAGVVDELEQERAEYESLAGYSRSNVQAAFGELTGQVGSEHQTVKVASAQAVETLVLQRMEEKSRFIARELLVDFDQGVVAPLIEAVRYSLGDLSRKLDPADVEAAPVDGWPRHLPQRDQGVPDDLVPGKTVALVIAPEAFPDLFDRLLSTTLGDDYDALHQRWRAVRHHVVTGDFLADRPPADRRLAHDVRPLFETVDVWQPREAILLGGEPDRPARFRLHTERDDLVMRARAWMLRDGSDFDDFLSLGLRAYLQEPDHRVSASEARDRERSFQSALDAAFEAAEPLVFVDPALLAQIHNRSITSHVVPGAIPLKNHRLEGWVTQFLETRLETQPSGTYDNVTQDERVKRISIYSMLEGALHPAVFRSLTEPIAQGYSDAIRDAARAGFWKWRRSRPLAQAVPLPMSMVRALVRGWFIARFLGLLDVVTDGHQTIVRLSGPEGEVIESLPLVSVPGENRPRQLGVFLETLALALPYSADAVKTEEMLEIYARLIGFGRVAGVTGSEVGEMRELTPILEEWVKSGTVYGEKPTLDARLEESEPGERATALAKLVAEVDAAYSKHAGEERRAGRIAGDNSWLGAAVLIHEELHRMEVALEARASRTTPEF